MSEQLQMFVDGKRVAAPMGSTVAIAVALAGRFCRRSITGEPRAPLCGMGVCFECRVTIDGEPQRRSCQVVCEPGMDVRTDG